MKKNAIGPLVVNSNDQIICHEKNAISLIVVNLYAKIICRLCRPLCSEVECSAELNNKRSKIYYIKNQ